MPVENPATSTRPYLLRALHDWCTDNGYTPYIAVAVGPGVQVPMEYVKNGEIVLNIGFEATSGLKMGNDVLAFKSRFGGVARDIVVPVDHVVAIYARENGQGMAFPVPTGNADIDAPTPAAVASSPVRGLRLAGTDDADDDPAVGGDVDEAEADALPEDGDDAPPDGPRDPAPAGGRPALKRVK